MTPGQARVALLGFLLVTVGVATNALFLQAGSSLATKAVAERPSASARRGQGCARLGEPAAAGRRGALWSSPEEQALRIARFAPDPGKIDPAPAGPDDTADAETIRAIQRELKLRGYGPVAGDGAMGLTTRAAIMAFEHDHGMALSARRTTACSSASCSARRIRPASTARAQAACGRPVPSRSSAPCSSGWLRSATSPAASMGGSAKTPSRRSAISRWTRAWCRAAAYRPSW